MLDSKLFSINLSLNSDIQPSLEELNQFLNSPSGQPASKKHRDDFTSYLHDIKAIEDFESPTESKNRYSLDEQKILGVLSCSQFFNHSIRFAIELYKYHNSKLRELDFKKPRAFVRAVREELAGLDPKRSADQKKIADLQARLDKRNQDIDALEKKRLELTAELKNIALYVRDFLARIQGLCEYSIAALGEPQLAKEMEQAMIEELKEQYKGDLREQRALGPLSRETAEKKKEDFVRHSEELVPLVLQDRHSLRGLYEQILDHVNKYASKVDAPVRNIEAKKGSDFEHERYALGKIEEDLVLIISNYQFAPKEHGETNSGEGADLVMGKRKEMMLRLLNFLQENAVKKEEAFRREAKEKAR